MNDQEKAKAAVEILERLTPWSQDHKKFIEATEFLRPIAAGTHVIVPVEPTDKMCKAAAFALDKAREKDGKLQDKRPYEFKEKYAIRYRAMIAAAKEDE